MLLLAPAAGTAHQNTIMLKLARLPLQFFEPTLEPDNYQLGQLVHLQASGLFRCALELQAHGGIVNTKTDSYGPTGAAARRRRRSNLRILTVKAARVLPSLFGSQRFPFRDRRPECSSAQRQLDGSKKQLTRPSADPHPALLTGLHIFHAALRTNTCPIKVTGFSAGCYNGAVLTHRKRPFKLEWRQHSLQFQLGAIALPLAVFRELMLATQRGASGDALAYGAHKLCIWAKDLGLGFLTPGNFV